jgi:hypothetical protein
VWNIKRFVQGSVDRRLKLTGKPACSSILFFASSLLLHNFFLSINNSTALKNTRSSYNFLNRRTQGNTLLLICLSIFVFPWPTFTFCMIAPFFLRWTDEMLADIGSLARGLDGLVAILGNGRKKQKNGEPPQFFLIHSLFYCRLSSHCSVKKPITWITCFEYQNRHFWHRESAFPSFIILTMTLG